MGSFIGVGSAASPMTARFSSFQNQQKQKIVIPSTNDLSRINIKENTKNILGEISEIDQEIAALQSTLLQAYSGSNIELKNNKILEDTNA